ncbi:MULTISPECIES: mandelate racemase/muconate lactonizing enzyme family protein [unclassified Kitasatospora]|uniref:mandelate racemase/muconate lactonizing enzyme family protein n=1 Tax=unclassified Kitasatospora TaxID=2633591 RepID=UPI00071118B7|nr:MULTISPECIES: enolase C-terminal domain-like protein [unclassified Kitasatospora]KQV04440.1 muconate cycloisomerase [Kitasatospora sp. Root107]KRB61029.1 muconate cycloisomerase [Kitasatospora sp. Root187]
MKLDLRVVELHLTEPLRISRSTMASRDAVELAVRHGGLSGYGEVVASTYLGLPTERILRHSRALDLARYPDPETALIELQRLEAPFKELPPGVLAGVEAALLDLVGKRAGAPVHQLLGLLGTPAAATARTIAIVDPVRAAAQAARLAVSGFRVLKVKAGSPDPEDDLARVRAVQIGAPEAELLLDPNGAWTVAQSLALIPRFAELGVTAVEQPTAPGHPEWLAEVAERSELPVIADEDAVSLDDAERLAGRVQGINIKLAKCGGVSAALRICAALHGSGTEVMLGCLTASSLGIAPAVHLVDRARWVDLDGHLLLRHDPWRGIGGTDGVVRAADRAGLGVRPAETPGTTA